MIKLICDCCGRDLNAIWQDNMAVDNGVLCEDCASQEAHNA